MKSLSVFICALLLLTGCAKNEIIIYGSSNKEDSDNEHQPGTSGMLVTFSASVEARSMTRAMSPMPKGIVNQIYAFNDDDTRLNTAVANGLYTTSSIGILTGAMGYKMYLSNGTYKIYAFSSNSSTPPPAITNGISAPLRNGVDYLWWENTDQAITTSQVHVPIVFQHIASQVVLRISEGDSLKLNSIVSATILPPTPGATLHFQTGIIDAASTYDTNPFEMGVKEKVAQAIVLPIATTTPMQLTLKVLADGENTPRTYTAGIPISGKLAGGFSYVYSVVLNSNSISFPEVSIKDWTQVDETGKPIYPNQ